MRTPKPFYRHFNGTYYLQLGKRQVALAKGPEGGDTEAAAYKRYFEIMAECPPGRITEPMPNAIVAVLCDQFLEWSERHHEPCSFVYYQTYLQDFCEHCGRMSVGDVKPYHVTKWLDRHATCRKAHSDGQGTHAGGRRNIVRNSSTTRSKPTMLSAKSGGGVVGMAAGDVYRSTGIPWAKLVGQTTQADPK